MWHVRGEHVDHRVPFGTIGCTIGDWHGIIFRWTPSKKGTKWKPASRLQLLIVPEHETHRANAPGPLVLGDLMAPDLEKRRQELRRTSSGNLDHSGHDHFHMLLQLRCNGHALSEPYRHGNLAPTDSMLPILFLFNEDLVPGDFSIYYSSRWTTRLHHAQFDAMLEHVFHSEHAR